ncbi:MAG: hypothetical protein EOP84_22465, partial [Verrucomicrobiaceae bacterium]
MTMHPLPKACPSPAGRRPAWLPYLLAAAFLIFVLCSASQVSAAEPSRVIIAQALVTEDAEEQAKLVASLAGDVSDETRLLLTAWREETIFFYEKKLSEEEDAPVERIPVILEAAQNEEGLQQARRVDTGEALKDDKGEPVRLLAADLTAAETDSNLRRAMKSVLDLTALG